MEVVENLLISMGLGSPLNRAITGVLLGGLLEISGASKTILKRIAPEYEAIVPSGAFAVLFGLLFGVFI